MVSRVVVVDTSLVVKWFVEEPDSLAAAALLESWQAAGIGLAAPELLIREFINSLFRKIQYSGMTMDHALSALAQLENAAIDLHDTETFGRRALELAVITGHHSVYDFYFFALAESLACECWTADQPFQESAARLPGPNRVRLLREFPAPE